MLTAPNYSPSTRKQRQRLHEGYLILNNQPAIAYALIKLMVSIDVINIEVFQVRFRFVLFSFRIDLFNSTIRKR